MVIKSTVENLSLASFTVKSKMGDLFVKAVPITLNKPFSNSTVSLNEDWFSNILISFAASSCGEII